MNSRVVQFSLLSITLITGVILGMTITVSEAVVGQNPLTEKKIGAKSLSPKSYGASTQGIVCGDKLCSDSTPMFDVEETHAIVMIDDHDPATPTSKLIQIAKFRPNTNKGDAITYIITYQITAGNSNLADIRVHVSSDVESLDYNISSLGILKSSVNVARIKALDPDSIDGGIVGFRVTAPTGMGIDRPAMP